MNKEQVLILIALIGFFFASIGAGVGMLGTQRLEVDYNVCRADLSAAESRLINMCRRGIVEACNHASPPYYD